MGFTRNTNITRNRIRLLTDMADELREALLMVQASEQRFILQELFSDFDEDDPEYLSKLGRRLTAMLDRRLDQIRELERLLPPEPGPPLDELDIGSEIDINEPSDTTGSVMN